MNLNLNTFLLISAIVALIFGLGFVLLPGVMFSIYGIASAPASFLGFRLFGSALIAIGLLTWFLRDSANWEAVRALLLSVAIGNVIGLLLVFFATINGTLSAMGWTAVLVYLLLLIGEGYFLSRGPASALERGSY
jgi:uncharacterized membrane protein YfcA